MNTVAIFDLLSLVAISFAIFFLLSGWKQALTRDTKVMLISLFALIFLHNFSNTLEWSSITSFLDPIEDVFEVLGAIFWIFFFYTFLRDFDLSERLKIEQALQESEHTLKTIFDNAMDGILLADIENKRLITGNKMICDMLGYKLEEIKSLTIKDIHPEVHFPYVNSVFDQQARGEFTLVREIPVQRKDGSVFYAEISSSPVTIAGRRYLLGIFRDVTIRVTMEQEVRQHAHDLEILRAVVQDVTSTLDIEKVLEKICKHATELLEADGSSVALYDEERQVMTYPYHYRMPSGLKKVIAQKGRGMAEYVMTTGKSVIIEDYPSHPRALKEYIDAGLKVLAAVPLFARGKAFGTLGVFSLTYGKKFTRRQLEILEGVGREAAIAIENARLFNELRMFSENLEQKVKERTLELEIANEKLKELDRLKSMFIASVSHELRTPLNSIIGFTGVILKGLTGEINDEQRDQLTRVYNSAKHLLELINDVIDISKIESGKIEPYIERFSLDEIVGDAVSTMKEQIHNKGLTLKTDIAPGILLKTDRRRLLQCIINYLSNAVKFTEKGSITLRAKLLEAGKLRKSEDEQKILTPDRDYIEFAVADTGIGIRKKDFSRLFNSFVRIDSPLKDRTSGTGLGLYLTRKLTEEVLKGSVFVLSEYRKGSTFGLRIPVEL
jgi:PAS domain S-box-containing protein